LIYNCQRKSFRSPKVLAKYSYQILIEPLHEKRRTAGIGKREILRGYSRVWLQLADENETKHTAHYKERHKFMSGLADDVLGELERRALN